LRRVAVLDDVHGNAVALRAALADRIRIAAKQEESEVAESVAGLVPPLAQDG
jgi:hypothetical protein